MCCGDVLWQIFVVHKLKCLKTFLSFLSYYLKGAKCEDRISDREKERKREREKERDGLVKAEFEREEVIDFRKVTEKSDFEFG